MLLPGVDPEQMSGFLVLNHVIDLRNRLDDPDALAMFVQAVQGEAPPTPPVADVCPYRGLYPFREEDAPLFYGREQFAEALRDNVRALPLVAVIGPSGSGKTSVVQAGLVPLLRREGMPEKTWGIVTFMPGSRPFHSLASALVSVWETEVTRRIHQSTELARQIESNSPSALEIAFATALENSQRADRLLMVVDQFEEALHGERGGRPRTLRRNLAQCHRGHTRVTPTGTPGRFLRPRNQS